MLDAGGFASIWLGQAAYKIVVTDLNGVVIRTVDNVSGLAPWYTTQSPTIWVSSYSSSVGGPGLFLMYGAGGNGEADFISIGAGGFTWYASSSSASIGTPVRTLSPSGALTVATLDANVTGNLTGNVTDALTGQPCCLIDS